MTVTIKDIAKKVGVSPSTVSRVANGSRAISEETRQRILDAMEEMHSIPTAWPEILPTGVQIPLGWLSMRKKKALFQMLFLIEAYLQSKRLSKPTDTIF